MFRQRKRSWLRYGAFLNYFALLFYIDLKRAVYLNLFFVSFCFVLFFFFFDHSDIGEKCVIKG